MDFSPFIAENDDIGPVVFIFAAQIRLKNSGKTENRKTVWEGSIQLSPWICSSVENLVINNLEAK